MQPKYLKTLLLLMLILAGSSLAKAQCKSVVSLLKKDNHEDGAKVVIGVDSKGEFRGSLIELHDGQVRIKEKFSGAGAATFEFGQLNRDFAFSYKIEVDFLSEEEFLCKKRVLIDIQFSDN